MASDPSDTNARLARFDGWQCKVHTSTLSYSYTPGTGCVIVEDCTPHERHYWLAPNGIAHTSPPAYDTDTDTDRNLLAGLLAKLTDQQWVKLDLRMFQRFAKQDIETDSQFFLTLPPADLAAAIKEVVCE